MKLFKNKKGMTAAELLVATTISTMLTAGVFSFASFVNHAQQEYQSSIELTNDARMVLETMVWGFRGGGNVDRKGIAEAASGTIISASQFQYIDINGVQHSLRVTSGTIEYQRGSGNAWTPLLDPNGTASYDASKYTTSLIFTAAPTTNAVIVRVVIGKRIASTNRWYYGSATTQVFFRNS